MKYYSIKRRPGLRLTDSHTVWALATKRGKTTKITRSLFKNPAGLGIIGKNLTNPNTNFELSEWMLYSIKEISKQKYEQCIKKIEDLYIKDKFLCDL